MKFFNVMKCVLCLRRSCPRRYQIGNRTFYSGLGYIVIECPKKLEKDPFYQPAERYNEKFDKDRKESLKRRKDKREGRKNTQLKKIVIVDDNVSFADTLSEFIEKPNKSVCIVFRHPEVLLRYLENNRVDIIITDYEMPVMNGTKVAKILLEKYPATRIVLMSGHDTNYLEQICKKEGIYGKVETISKSNSDFFSALV